jgi:NAD(P)-dependent dehydrogenase (short-subunit alcohol dehydrogenase family)
MRTRAAAEGRTYDEVLAGDVHRMALRRIATEEDVARAVVFLAGEHASATTGTTIDVNSGQLFT